MYPETPIASRGEKSAPRFQSQTTCTETANMKIYRRYNKSNTSLFPGEL